VGTRGQSPKPKLLPEARAGKIYKQPIGSAVTQEAGYELAEAEPDVAAADGGEASLADKTPVAAGAGWYYAQWGEEIGPVSSADFRLLAL